jgi:hypothetical protein
MLTESLTFRSETKVQQAFSKNRHSWVAAPLAIGAERAYLALMHRQVPMQLRRQPAGKE